MNMKQHLFGIVLLVVHNCAFSMNETNGTNGNHVIIKPEKSLAIAAYAEYAKKNNGVFENTFVSHAFYKKDKEEQNKAIEQDIDNIYDEINDIKKSSHLMVQTIANLNELHALDTKIALSNTNITLLNKQIDGYKDRIDILEKTCKTFDSSRSKPYSDSRVALKFAGASIGLILFSLAVPSAFPVFALPLSAKIVATTGMVVNGIFIWRNRLLLSVGDKNITRSNGWHAGYETFKTVGTSAISTFGLALILLLTSHAKRKNMSFIPLHTL